MNHRKPDASSLLASLRAILAETRHPARIGALGLGALAPFAALANPTGGQVVGGSATISTPSANATVINQSSQRAAIDWQQFSVGANQYVQFVQPNSSAVVLNRVIGSNPSSIFGNITANGQVFLVNPNGILFAPGATLDVAGLVASAQDISTADFMAGKLSFIKGSGAPDATVINQGTISTPNGYVVLAGDYVENDGVINAESGRVLLAAGGSTTLTLDKSNGLIAYSVDGATLARLAGVKNAGDISADGGAVVMTADVANALTATAVNNTGLVTAHSIQSRDGVIMLLAKGGDIDNSGTLDASATEQGVTGGDIVIRSTEKTALTPTSVIDAEGDGAKGGFIDLSGHDLHISGKVDTGRGGSLLLDPAKLFITNGPSSSSGKSITSGDYVGQGFIDSKLNAGANVELVASNSIVAGVPVGVPHSPATAISAAGTGNLTIKTGTLQLHSGASPSGSLIGFSPNHCGLGVCTPRSGLPTLVYAFTPTSGTINLTGLTINIKGAFTANASHGNVTLAGVTANGVSVTAGTVNLNGSVNAGSGNLTVSATRPGPASPSKIIVASGKTLTGKSVNLLASASYGGTISAGAITATGGSLVVNAIGKTGSFAGNNKFKAKLGNLSATGAVQVNANGLSGTVSVGSITAHGVTVNGAAGATGKSKVTTGKIVSTGGVFTVNLSETGHSGSLTAGSISAAGVGVTVHAGDSLGGNITVGNVITAKYVQVNTNAAGTIAVNNITATGAVGGTGASKSEAVVINDTGGTITEGSASTLKTTSGNVKITAGHVTLGTVNDGGTLNVTAHETGPVVASFSGKGTITAKSVSITASASYGGKISAGAVTATGGGITLLAHATTSGSPGNAAISAGNLTATGLVSVTASNATAKPGASIALGNVAGQAVHINAVGATPTLTVGAVNANGTKSSAGVFKNIILQAANAAAGRITVNGAVKSSHGNASFLAATGLIKLSGAVYGNNVSLQGGSVSDAGALSISGHGNVTASGNIKAASVTITNAPPSGGGNITIRNVTVTTGNISLANTAHSGAINAGNLLASNGSVQVMTNATSSGGNVSVGSVVAKTISLQTNAPRSGNIRVNGNLKATGAFSTGSNKGMGIVVNANDTGGVSASGGNVTVTGSGSHALLASHGGVRIHTHGGLDSGAHIIIGGGIVATGSVDILSSDLGSCCGSVSLKNVTAQAAHIVLKGAGSRNTIKVGAVTATGTKSSGSVHDDVLIADQASKLPLGSISISGPIKSSHGNISLVGSGASVTAAHLQAGGNVVITDIKLPATGFSASAGGSLNYSMPGAINLSGLNFKVTKALNITAGGGLALKGAHLAGSAVNLNVTGNVSNGGTAASITAGAGGVTIKATGNVLLGGDKLHVSTGAAILSAGGSLDLTGASGSAVGGLTLHAGTKATEILATLMTGGALTDTAGGSLDLTSVTASAKSITLNAGKQILVGNAALTAGSAFDATGTGISDGAAHATIAAGSAVLDAKGGNIVLDGGALLVGTGNATLSAAGNISLTTATLSAGSVHMTASGSIGLNGATLTAGKIAQVATSKNVNLDGVTITAGTFIADAKGNVSDGGAVGKITANGMAMVAGGGISMTATQLNIGTGSISSVHGDSTLLAGLAVEGLSPASPNPNGAFIAGGAVTLGNLQLTGSYLLLQGSAVSVLGKVTAPQGTLVQVEPFNLTLPIDIEDSTLLKSVLASAALTQASGSTSFGLTNTSFLSLFGGDTVAVGGTGVSGDVTIGANGPLNIGNTNLIIFTTGNVTGLGTVTSTGIVQSLLSILGPAVPPVTAGEIDPTAGSGTNTGLGDETDKRKIGGGGGTGGNQQPAGTVSQDNGNASVCH